MRSQTEAPAYHPLKPLIDHRAEARENALKSLAGYKFTMFGFWASIWVHMNRCIKEQDPGQYQANPFKFLVHASRKEMESS